MGVVYTTEWQAIGVTLSVGSWFSDNIPRRWLPMETGTTVAKSPIQIPSESGK